MNALPLTVCIVSCLMLLLLLPLYSVNGQDYFIYSVQINYDGSALWKITNFSGISGAVDTWEGFQIKVFNLINSAGSETNRSMGVDENSLQINTTISSASKTTEYSFLWQNFSKIQDNEIMFGDVFQQQDFFNQLYGNAALQISYPSNFSIKSIAPKSGEQDNSERIISWTRTQDLVDSKSNIILISTPANQNSSQISWQLIAIIGGISTLAVTLSLVGLYSFKKSKSNIATKIDQSPIDSYHYETEEDKVLRLLKSSGGSLRQSDINDKCSFSKAKTSQLLAALEKRGNITRYKKGRDKIVNLTDQRVKVNKDGKPD